jgi:hypothetical protein
MFSCDLREQSLHALIPFGWICLARIRASWAEVSIGVANRKVFRELCVRTEMASADRVIGGFSRPTAVGITPIAPDASAQGQNEAYRDQKAWPSFHRSHLMSHNDMSYNAIWEKRESISFAIVTKSPFHGAPKNPHFTHNPSRWRNGSSLL